MKLSVQSLAFVLALPSITNAWSSFDTYGLRLMRPTPPTGSVLQKALEHQRALLNRAYKIQTMPSPRYEITNDDENFQVAIDFPGFKTSDINVNIEEDGQVLAITGTRKTSNFESKFSKSFFLDPAVDTDNFSAVIENGVLTVSAPKDLKKIDEKNRNIPIIQAAAGEQEETVVSKDSFIPEDAANAEDEEHEMKVPGNNYLDKL